MMAALSAFAANDIVERGRYLTYAGGCISCHTEDAEDAIPLAGGRAMETPFGTFYSPNLTPDMNSGIGGWSDDDFVNAFWEGVSPEGKHYFPAFPYTSYTGASRDDLLAIKAYLFSLEPVPKENADHDLAWYMSSRMAAGAWKAVNFELRQVRAGSVAGRAMEPGCLSCSSPGALWRMSHTQEQHRRIAGQTRKWLAANSATRKSRTSPPTVSTE